MAQIITLHPSLIERLEISEFELESYVSSVIHAAADKVSSEVIIAAFCKSQKCEHEKVAA
jgi:hypothetical protein